MEAELKNISGNCDVLFVAGEHSGDQHAALIIADLLEENPSLEIKAIGGPEMEKAGARLMHDLTESSVVGLFEVLKHYNYFKTLFNKLIDWIEDIRPKLIVTVDYPGFNLRLAEKLKQRGLSKKGGGTIKLYQYVSPQIWAWKSKRRFKIADVYDEMGVIFPFEVECYKDTSLSVDFVGHPFCREGHESALKYDKEGCLLLLPGSRVQAVSRILPCLLNVVEEFGDLLKRDIKIIYPSDKIKRVIKSLLEHLPKSKSMIELIPSGMEVKAAVVLTSSGTMSLQCALSGIPGAVVYRAHPITYWLGSRLIKVPYLGIANIVLDKEFYPEFIQGDAVPEKLINRVRCCLDDQSIIDETHQRSEELSSLLSVEVDQTPAQRILSLID